MKITLEQQQQGVDLLENLIKKSWESATFKEQFIANPESMIKEVSGIDFKEPNGKKIVVEDQTDDSIVYLNIPAEPNLDDLALTEEQLELVAGGATPTVTTTTALTPSTPLAIVVVGSLALGVAIYAATH